MDELIPEFFTDTLEPVHRKHATDVFRIEFTVVPLSQKDECTENVLPNWRDVEVWVDAKTLQEAERKARKEVMATEWFPANFVCWKLMPYKRSWIPDWMAMWRYKRWGGK